MRCASAQADRFSELDDSGAETAGQHKRGDGGNAEEAGAHSREEQLADRIGEELHTSTMSEF